jgi:hypothetical protein
VFGEVFHRISGLLLDARLPPNALEQLGALMADPMGSLNRQVFGRRRLRSELPALPPFDGGFRVGGIYLSPAPVHSPVAALFGLDLSYGFPGERMAEHWAAFDHFRVGAAVAGPGSITFDAYIRGVVVGRGFGRPETSAGAWGLYAVFDFVSAPRFRLGSTGLGPGISWRLRWAHALELRLTGTLAAVPMGGVGTREDTDKVRPVTETTLLYFLGPGVQAGADAELRLGDAATVQVSGQAWQLGFNADAGRSEQVLALTMAGRLRVVHALEVGASVSVFRRDSAWAGGLDQDGAIGSLFVELPFGNEGP